MEQEQKDSPKQTGGSKPNVIERVRTGLVNNVPIPPPRAERPRPWRVARGPVETNPASPSTFPTVQGDNRQTGASGVDARWPLTLLALLVAGIVIGALVGAVVAGTAFP